MLLEAHLSLFEQFRVFVYWKTSICVLSDSYLPYMYMYVYDVLILQMMYCDCCSASHIVPSTATVIRRLVYEFNLDKGAEKCRISREGETWRVEVIFTAEESFIASYVLTMCTLLPNVLFRCQLVLTMQPYYMCDILSTFTSSFYICTQNVHCTDRKADQCSGLW